MKIVLRLLGAICISTLLITAGFALLQIRQDQQRLMRDLERRAVLIGEGLKESVEPAMRRKATPAVLRLLKKFSQPHRQIAVYDALGTAVASAPDPASALPSTLPELTEALTRGSIDQGLRIIQGKKTYVYATPLEGEDQRLGALVVLLDATALDTAELGVWQSNALRFLALALGTSVITFIVVRLSITRPATALAEWMKTLKTGQPAPAPNVPDDQVFGPLAVQVTGLARRLYHAEAAAEREAALRLSGEAVWTEERLKQFVQLRVGAKALFVVSNREPVSHVYQNSTIVPQTPASGVVSALEPVARACGGVWVAHGSGDADRQTADAHGRLGLPPDDPRYTLRRVWLTAEEEAGYYYGFANEGLWPLCHVVHARPLFRPADWAHYRDVNARFAAALLEEMEGVEAPLVLVQDYHFALLPALVRAARPDARIAIFWHIPWPNFEAFDICPWQRELLEGMLAADLIGFHTQYHCNNFLDSVDRALEARIDGEHFAVVRGQHTAYVKPFPISVAPGVPDGEVGLSRQALDHELGVSAEILGVGVERVDYTKGLLERFQALARFFELYPEYQQRLVFVQLAAPSRSRIPRYQELQAEIRTTVDHINRSLQTRGWRPIVYLERHYERRHIWSFYRHAAFCMVTSLHDGMNLVAKEFVSARDDGQGVLILSRLTGAARELREALLINPYDVDAMAEAIRTAVEMSPDEQRLRMSRMHQWVAENNVYGWAGRLVGELARIRRPPAKAQGQAAAGQILAEREG
ncbi:MAG TPA: trehalose-6-phosphate synthase [Methylomirabilota bacterium]